MGAHVFLLSYPGRVWVLGFQVCTLLPHLSSLDIELKSGRIATSDGSLIPHRLSGTRVCRELDWGWDPQFCCSHHFLQNTELFMMRMQAGINSHPTTFVLRQNHGESVCKLLGI